MLTLLEAQDKLYQLLENDGSLQNVYRLCTVGNKKKNSTLI